MKEGSERMSEISSLKFEKEYSDPDKLDELDKTGDDSDF
mgnify:CR=1 FL=1